MSAYLLTLINGNKSYGGYLSVDGEKSFPIQDDMTYELSPGQHSLSIYTNSDAQRKVGSVQASVYNNTSSSGVILDAIERQSALSNMGDGWVIDVFVQEGQLLTLSVLTKGSKFAGTPLYEVDDLTDEAIKELEEKFEAWRNTPVRSKKQIVWGLILASVGAIIFSNYIRNNNEENAGGILVVWGIIFVVGVILFLLGMKKKIRRK